MHYLNYDWLEQFITFFIGSKVKEMDIYNASLVFFMFQCILLYMRNKILITCEQMEKTY